jgi:hypothetical protein
MFLFMDLCNNGATACYGSDNAFNCLHSRIQEAYQPVINCLGMFNSIPFVNVSTVHCGVLGYYQPCDFTSSTSIPCELTHLLGFHLVYNC